MTSQFTEGQIVEFSRTPNASYLHVGIQYVVEEVGAREVYFRRVAGQSGTSDSHGMLRSAQWKVIQ